MACLFMQSWTLSGLVGTFLDLAIAYLLLCESTLAFFASTFLGFFGLSLPSPCNGVFGTPNSNYCMERLLVDYPLQTVSSVYLSVKNKFPFDSIWPTNQNCADYAKVSRVLCLDRSCGDAESHSSVNCGENMAIECSSLPVYTEADADHFNDDDKAPSSRNFGEKASLGIKFNEPSFAEIKCNLEKKLGYGGNEKNVIRLLKQALEEVCLELEKERDAAASAMDAAMAMILCLQEKKASVEMVARQYQRIIEEKSAYDAEEMNILKEIIVRREAEKHFLEKEIEAYRQLCSGNEQLQDDIPDIENARRWILLKMKLLLMWSHLLTRKTLYGMKKLIFQSKEI